MVQLPRTCVFCRSALMHYGSCRCTPSRLAAIEAERRAIVLRLARLDEMEAEVRGWHPDELSTSSV